MPFSTMKSCRMAQPCSLINAHLTATQQFVCIAIELDVVFVPSSRRDLLTILSSAAIATP